MRALRGMYLVATILAMTANGGLSARQHLASISGVIRDTSGGGLPGATITIASEGGVPRAAVTDSAGRYRVAIPVPGRYTVRVGISGFDTREMAIEVLPGQDVIWSGALLVGPAFGEPSIERQVARLTGPSAVDCGRYSGGSEAALRRSLTCALGSAQARRPFSVIVQFAAADAPGDHGLAAGPDGIMHLFKREPGGRLRLQQCPSPQVSRTSDRSRDSFQFTCRAGGQTAIRRAIQRQ